MEKKYADELVDSLFLNLASNNEEESILLVEKHPFLLAQSLNSNGTTVFHYAVFYGNYTVIDYLVNKKQIDVHQVDKDGDNAMFYALDITEKDNGKMMKKLYDLGISIHGISSTGSTLLIESAENDHLTSLEFLIEHGADVNYESNDGNSLLSVLEIGEYPTNIPFLMEHLDKFNKKNQKRLKKLRLKYVVERGIIDGKN